LSLSQINNCFLGIQNHAPSAAVQQRRSSAALGASAYAMQIVYSARAAVAGAVDRAQNRRQRPLRGRTAIFLIWLP
jgi:hypothetical protein